MLVSVGVQMVHVAALVLLLVPPSSACLNGYPTVAQEYRSRSAVFVGTVVSQRHEPATVSFDQPGITYVLKVDERFKGRLEERVEVFSENTDAEFPMTVGKKYLVFAYRDHERQIVDNCGNSEVFSASSPKLKEVRALAARSSASK